MIINKISNILQNILSQKFSLNIFKSQKVKTHDFRNLEQGVDYFVDFTESGECVTMTTALTVKREDQVILLYQKQAIVYRVEELESYWNDESIQRILLKKISKAT